MEKNQLKMTLGMILKRGNYLYHLSFWLYGLYHDIKIAGKSLNNTIFYDAQGAYPVQSISYIYLNEFMKHFEYNEDDVLVDVGCAWGRLIGYLRQKTNLKKIYGVELNKSVAVQAKKNFKNDPKVEIICGNILDNIPKDGTIFYLFNPFDENVLVQFLDAVEKKIPGPVKVLYLYPTCEHIFDGRDLWQKLSNIKLAPKHMGELELAVYQKGEVL